MNNDWQTWAALGIVALPLALLVRRAFRRHRSHHDCGCAGVDAGRELRSLQRRIRR
jgi:hypothetical protein